MPYSVGLYFDERTDTMVRSVWKRLAALNLADYFHVSGNRPHITLGIFNLTNLEEIENVIKRISLSRIAFQVSFQHIGVFQSATNAVFWAPVVTQEFLAFHNDFYVQILNADATTESHYYTPGNLVPHCGLAMEIIDSHLIPQIVEVCQSLPNPHTAMISEIGMLKMRPVQHLFSFPFSGC